VQKIVSALSVLPVVDQRICLKPSRGATAGTIKYPAAVRLGTGTLLRLTLLRLSTQEHVLLLTMHHIISDALAGVFIREVAALRSLLHRQAFAVRTPNPYAQQQWLQGEVLDQLNYWKQQLNGAKMVLSYQQIGRDRTFRLPLGQSTLSHSPLACPTLSDL